MPKILVTGGSGFIGGALIRHLLSNGDCVIATTTCIRKDFFTHPNLTWKEWDYTKQHTLDISWHTIDAIVHTAAPKNLFDFPKNADPIYDILLAATHYLLKKSLQHNINNFNLISTGDVIGHPEAQDEASHYYNPHSFYAAIKASAELITKSYSQHLKTKILRVFHPYGPNGDCFLVNRLIKKIAQNETITIEGTKGITLNPIWIADLIQGIHHAIQYPLSAVFHLAGTESLNLRALLDKIAALLNVSAKIQSRNSPIPSSHAGIAQSSYKKLNWTPKTKLNQGINSLINDLSKLTR